LSHLSVEDLVGKQLSKISFAADMLCAQFGSLTEVIGRQGKVGTVGEFALHVQTVWRIADNRAQAGSGDRYDDSNAAREAIERRLDQFFKPNISEARGRIITDTGWRVISAAQSPMGDLRLDFANGCRFDAFIYYARREAWRLFRPGLEDHHLVIPDDDPAVRDTVLFDLDGTLTDPLVGISTSMQYALEKLGRPIPSADELRVHIGPPLQETFPKLLRSDDPELASEALRLYRERYAGPGKFENEIIPGIRDAISALTAEDYLLFVATSKLEAYSIEIVEHFGLAPYFRRVHGSRLDGSNANKAELISHIILTEKIDPTRTIMIGDRLHDIVGAAANGVRTIGVLWGYGDRTELEAAGAARIAERPEQLPGLVAELLLSR